MTGLGLRQEDISKLLHIDLKTLRKHYRTQLDTGVAEANMRVAQSLFHMATREKVPSAAIFWLKARAGWRDRDAQDGHIIATDITVQHLVAARAIGAITLAEQTQQEAPEIEGVASRSDGSSSTPLDLYAPAKE